MQSVTSVDDSGRALVDFQDRDMVPIADDGPLSHRVDKNLLVSC